MADMQGKVALITGAGSGIGRRLAARLAERGCRVVCGDLNQAGAQAAADAVRQAGGEALAVNLDVTSRSSVQAFVDEAMRAFGRVDYLVNSAGVWEYGSVLEVSEERWDRVVDVNLKGTFFCCQAAAVQMVRQGGGAIVNIASIAGRNGGNWNSPQYAASKGGVIALTMQAARELASKGVRVNAVAPGPTESPMTESWPDDIRKGIASRTPLGRWGQPDDIAAVIVFLLSDDAGFVVGETVEVNGGLLTH